MLLVNNFYGDDENSNRRKELWLLIGFCMFYPLERNTSFLSYFQEFLLFLCNKCSNVRTLVLNSVLFHILKNEEMFFHMLYFEEQSQHD